MAKKENTPTPAPPASPPTEDEIQSAPIREKMKELLERRDGNIGRPTLFTHEVAAVILIELSEGKTLKAVCAQRPDFPAPSTVRGWVTENREGFSALYARARDIGLDAMAEELFDIADDGSNDLMTITKGDFEYEIENKEVTNRSKLRAQVRQWYLAKMAPKRYGEKVEVTTVPKKDNAPMEFKTPEEAQAAWEKMVAGNL